MLAFYLALCRFLFAPFYAITHPVSVRNALVDLVVDLIDAGAGSPSVGVLIFQASGSPDEMATLQFSMPAFGSASAGVATANSITADPSSNGGTISAFSVRNSSNSEVFAGTVTATGGGGDITLNSVAVSAGQQVSMTSFTYTAPA